jgi:hypothetical protein
VNAADTRSRADTVFLIILGIITLVWAASVVADFMLDTYSGDQVNKLFAGLIGTGCVTKVMASWRSEGATV